SEPRTIRGHDRNILPGRCGPPGPSAQGQCCGPAVLMLEFLHSTSVWLETLLNAVSDNFWLSIGFIFLVAIGEAVFILGLFVPSTPVLLLVGGIIATGKLPFWEIYFAAVLGAVIG